MDFDRVEHVIDALLFLIYIIDHVNIWSIDWAVLYVPFCLNEESKYDVTIGQNEEKDPDLHRSGGWHLDERKTCSWTRTNDHQFVW